MHLHVPFLTFILALAPPSDARSSLAHSAATATERLHKFALRHSAGLARDIRVLFQGASKDQQPISSSNRVYCVRPDPLSRNNATSPATATNGGAHATSTTAAPAPTFTSIFKLQESHSGSNFFSGWDFWNLPDPTHGIVQYLDQPTAQSNNLTSINSAGNAVIRVDTTPQVSNARMSVRITTQSTFTGGLFVLDAVHMPTGCGAWPAFWSDGPNWPAGGEIDIIEGVNDYTNNQATIHTNPGCSVPPSSNSTSLAMSGSLISATDCAALDTGDQGCGVRASSANSFGAAFNSIGGGVYAMLWDNDGIAVYFFPRSAIPPDLEAQSPEPQTWGLPLARWPAASCNPFEFFYNHSVVFDTTLCGDWAGGVWQDSGIPGQESSCATRTGFSTCNDFVLNSGASFEQAYWEVSSLKIYQTSRQS